MDAVTYYSHLVSELRRRETSVIEQQNIIERFLRDHRAGKKPVDFTVGKPASYAERLPAAPERPPFFKPEPEASRHSMEEMVDAVLPTMAGKFTTNNFRDALIKKFPDEYVKIENAIYAWMGRLVRGGEIGRVPGGFELLVATEKQGVVGAQPTVG